MDRRSALVSTAGFLLFPFTAGCAQLDGILGTPPPHFVEVENQTEAVWDVRVRIELDGELLEDAEERVPENDDWHVADLEAYGTYRIRAETDVDADETEFEYPFANENRGSHTIIIVQNEGEVEAITMILD